MDQLSPRHSVDFVILIILSVRCIFCAIWPCKVESRQLAQHKVSTITSYIFRDYVYFGLKSGPGPSICYGHGMNRAKSERSPFKSTGHAHAHAHARAPDRQFLGKDE